MYIDSLFLLNLAVNCLLLLAAGRVTASDIKLRRMLLAGVFGGLWAVAAVFPALGFLSLLPMKLLCGLVMSAIAFGGGTGMMKRTAALFALVMLFGGGVWAAYYAMGGQGSPESPGLKLVLPAVGLCYAAVALWCRKTPVGRRRTARMTVEFRDRRCEVRALIDSGNELRDPLTNRPVVIVGAEEFMDLLPEGLRKLADPAQPVESFRRLEEAEPGRDFRLLSYKALGVESGLLLAMRSGRIIVGGREREGILVAAAPGKISEQGGYTALAGIDI